MIARWKLYYHTIRRFRLRQLFGQLFKPIRLKRGMKETTFQGEVSRKVKFMIPELDLDEEYLSRFAPDALLNHEITLLNERKKINLNTWKVEASPLWIFNLNYFEYGVAMAAQYYKKRDDRFYLKLKEIYQSWIRHKPNGSDHPYTISMRLPNLLISLDLFGKIMREDENFYAETMNSIYLQYRTLIKRKETWQLGNHYFENLKTIVICSILFDEEAIYEKHIHLLLKELQEEVLADGVHFELSPMYHKIILEDLIRITYTLQQAGKQVFSALLPVIQKMADSIYSLEFGMGKTPLFNDSGDYVSKTSKQLCAAAKSLFDIKPDHKEAFRASGYYKLYDDNIALLFDAGMIGPNYMPGHGHCDCMSFEISIGHMPLFVNGGTFCYQGELRSYFRSARAHNTVMIGDHEQSECWGEHRVARRVNTITSSKSSHGITGSCVNYLGERHERTVSLHQGRLSILDSTAISGHDMIHSYLHIAPTYKVNCTENTIVVNDRGGIFVCEIQTVDCKLKIHSDGELCQYAPGFGIMEQGICLEFSWESDEAQHGYAIRFHNNGKRGDDSG